MNKQKGFTLVELLVVIAIIAILAGAVLLAINPVAMMQKSRDATRLNDMDALRNAITLAITEGEIQLIVTGPHTSSVGAMQAVNGTGFVAFTIPDGKTGLSRYVPTLPVDPTNSGNLVYTFQSTLTDFELNAVLEHSDNLPKMVNDGGNNTGAYEVGTSLMIIGGTATTTTTTTTAP